MASSHSSHRPRATKKCTTVHRHLKVEQIIIQIRSNVSCETVRYIPRIYPHLAVQLQDSEFVYVPDTYVMAIYGLLGPETKVQRVRSYYVRTYGLSFDIAL